MHGLKKLLVNVVALMIFESVAHAQSKLSGDRLFRDVSAAVLDLRDARGNRVVGIGEDVVMDAEALDSLAATLGFQRDRSSERNVALAGRSLRLQSWDSTVSCAVVRTHRRCSLAEGITVIRYFSPRWIKTGKSLSIEIGLYHRTQLQRDESAVGGSVRLLSFEFRNGAWVMTSAKLKAVA